MQDILIIKYYPKEESTMPFNALEALVSIDAPKPLKDAIEVRLEGEGFDFMDDSIEVEGLEGRWDYFGKILPNRLVSDDGE